MVKFLVSTIVGDLISDNFCLKTPPFPHKTTQKLAEGQKMKILALRLNSTKFCIHNLWASRELEMQILTIQNGVGGGAQGDAGVEV